MQITQTNGNGIIEKARSDCGRVQYWPIGNDRLLIDGRDADRGRFAGGGEVPEDLWDIACDLRHEVDDYNHNALDGERRAAVDREADRQQRIADSLRGTRGTYADPNTF